MRRGLILLLSLVALGLCLYRLVAPSREELVELQGAGPPSAVVEETTELTPPTSTEYGSDRDARRSGKTPADATTGSMATSETARASREVRARDNFEARYEGVGATELDAIAAELRVQLDAEVESLAESRFAAGLYEEGETKLVQGAQLGPRGREPKGLGRTWPVSKHRREGAEMVTRTTFLTETEYPDLWAHRDEYSWVVRRLRSLHAADGK